MPVDKHPEEKIPGVELVLTRLHAGGKFSSKNYKYSGGLHGVGVSVVNALSKKLTVAVKRGGNVHEMTFANGDRKTPLKVTGKVGNISTRSNCRCRNCATCCARKPCCVRACGCGCTMKPRRRRKNGITKTD